jgi:hypothetical protein
MHILVLIVLYFLYFQLAVIFASRPWPASLSIGFIVGTAVVNIIGPFSLVSYSMQKENRPKLRFGFTHWSYSFLDDIRSADHTLSEEGNLAVLAVLWRNFDRVLHCLHRIGGVGDQ